MVFELLFWVSLIILIYTYFGFLLFVVLISSLKSYAPSKKDIIPPVSIIICAYNEEASILSKIQNCMELDYPKDSLEIIFVSDGSTDRTNEILQTIDNKLLRTHIMRERCGKTACQNAAVNAAKNDILFFTDATIMHPPNTLKLLLRNFNDSSVGCVTGMPVFKQDSSPTSHGLGKRDRYELFLRLKLNQIHTLFGAQDCIYAIPRRLYAHVREDLDSGFVGPLMILEKGYRTVYEPEALAYVNRRTPTVADELTRRSRIVLRGMRGLVHMQHLMNPFKYGFTAISLISSRLLRWLSPIFLLTMFISNIFILYSPLYLGTFFLQLSFYGVALAAYFLDKNGYRVGTIFSIPLYFCILMCSAALGIKNLLTGQTGQMWETRR